MSDRRETDMNFVRSMACEWLDIDIEETSFPGVVRHPFTTSTVCGVRGKSGHPEILDITENEDNMLRWKQTISDIIEETNSVFNILMIMTRPYRFVFLVSVFSELSDIDKGVCLSYVWTDSEDPGNLSSSLVELLFCSVEPEYLMSDEELEILDDLPMTVQVYRGVSRIHFDQEASRLSWTLDRDVARKFAKRFSNKGDGFIYTGYVDKRDILAYFDSRGEKEVICHPCNISLLDD